jgi:hypothetical protein
MKFKAIWAYASITDSLFLVSPTSKKPLSKFMEKQSFQWTPEVEVAFQTLKGALCAYPQPGERFTVDTDASNIRIGGVLSQV